MLWPNTLQIFCKMQDKHIKPILDRLKKYHKNRRIKESRVPIYIEPPELYIKENPKESEEKRGVAIIDFDIDNNGNSNE